MAITVTATAFCPVCCGGEENPQESSCCIFPSSCGIGPEAVLHYGETLNGYSNNTKFGDYTNGVFLEASIINPEENIWAVYKDGNRSEIHCLGSMFQAPNSVAAVIASSYTVSVDVTYPSQDPYNVTATLGSESDWLATNCIEECDLSRNAIKFDYSYNFEGNIINEAPIGTQIRFGQNEGGPCEIDGLPENSGLSKTKTYFIKKRFSDGFYQFSEVLGGPEFEITVDLTRVGIYVFNQCVEGISPPTPFLYPCGLQGQCQWYGGSGILQVPFDEGIGFYFNKETCRWEIMAVFGTVPIAFKDGGPQDQRVPNGEYTPYPEHGDLLSNITIS